MYSRAGGNTQFLRQAASVAQCDQPGRRVFGGSPTRRAFLGILLAMPLGAEKARSPWRRTAIAFGVWVCVCTVARGQTTPVGFRDQFVDKAFTKCGDEYYLLLTDYGKLFCGGIVPWDPLKCQRLIEYKNANFPLPTVKNGGLEKLTVADNANDVAYRGYVLMDYSISRSRHIVDGVWGPWADWEDKKENGPFKIEHFEQRNGQWLEEIGPDILKIPYFDKSIGWLQAKASCQDINNPPAALPNPPKARTGVAVTTRQLLDPNPNKPRECAVPEGTTVLIVGDAPQYGKAKVRVWNRKPEAISCSDALVVNEDDIRPLGNRAAAVQSPSPPPAGGQSSNVKKMTPVETTVGSKGLQLRALPRADYAVAFTVPASSAVIIDAKSPDGWLHVIAKQSKEHWTPTPPFYGWAPPGSFPEVP